MAEEKKAFGELLSEAPLATNEDTVSLMGALERSHESGKFLLVMSPGRCAKLSIDSVKGYQVLGGGVGQVLVRVEVDREALPDSLRIWHGPFKNPALDGLTLYSHDKSPSSDKNPLFDPTAPASEKYIIESTGTYQETLGDPYAGGDPWSGTFFGPGAVAVAPFALAAPHQVPQNTVAALRGGVGSTRFWWDIKHPWQDGATGVPPYLD